MATCINSYLNPNQENCNEVVKMWAEIGLKDYGDWKHTTTQSIKLVLPDREETVYNYSRLGNVFWNEYAKATDAIACVGAGGATSYYAASTYDQDPYRVTFIEKQTIVENDILFLDLRYDILVREERTYLIDKNVSSDDETQWNQYGSVFKAHKIVPGDVVVTLNSKIYVNNVEIDSTTSTFGGENPSCFALPPMAGYPQANTQTNGEDDLYYIWTDNKDEDGGYDLYYPSWVRGLTTYSDEFDIKNRNRHREVLGLVPYTRVPYSGTISSFNKLLLVPTEINGAWPVSSQVITEDTTDYYRAYTTLNFSGNFITTLHPTADDVATILGATDSILPLAPL